jgi:hypothetical protein
MNMKTLKVYVAGKISPNSLFKTSFWRDEFCKDLEKKSGIKIINLDPTKSEDFEVNENDAGLVYGRNAFLIKSADIVIVYLSDDISVGGSQEMLIAKYFRKPLIGIAPEGGKFNNREKERRGKIYNNWTEPFVVIPCDIVVNDVSAAADWISKGLWKRPAKGIECIDEALEYYRSKFLDNDRYANGI